MLMLVFSVICAVESASKETLKNKETLIGHVQTECWTSMGFYLFLPLAGLTIVLSRRNLFTKLLMQVDRNCVSVLCPSFSKREKLLNWARGRLPVNWSSHSRTLSGGVFDLWSDGSLLCTLLNTAVPGACPNPHRHWKKPPLHAQAMAYKYLGIVPVFTETDFSADFSSHLERNFINYLNDLQNAITNFHSRQDPQQFKFSSLYIARGMGLATGEQHKESIFYIYPNRKTNQKPSSLLIQIRGPYGTYGQACVPAFFKNKLIPDVNIAQSTFLSKLGLKNDKTATDIEILVEMEDERAKITYTAHNFGMYEISLIANGELMQGCPFNVHIIPTVLGASEENFQNLVRKKRVVSKFIQKIKKAKIVPSNKNVNNDHTPSIVVTSITEEVEEESVNNNKTDVCNYNATTDETDASKTFIKTNSESVRTEESESVSAACNDVKLSEMENGGNREIITNEIENRIESPLIEEKIKKTTNETQKIVNNKLEKELIDAKKINSERNELNEQYKEHFQSTRNKITEKINEQSQTEKFIQKKNNINKVQIPHKFNNKNSSIVSSSNIDYKYFPEPKNDDKPTKFAPKSANTSPICPTHIESEVEKKSNVPAAEKRKRFTNKKSHSEAVIKNSSFSECENVVGSKSCVMGELSVLNILDSIKKTEKQNNGLPSTVSLPDMKQMDNDELNYKELYREKKDFWEQMSTVSSNDNISISHSENVGKRFDKNVRNKKEIVSRSVDDLATLTFVAPHEKGQKYKSVDNSLDTCTQLTIEERKKLLLKHKYEEELAAKAEMLAHKRAIRSLSLNNDTETLEESVKKEKPKTLTAMEQKIRIYDKNYNSTPRQKPEEKTSNKLNNRNKVKVTNTTSTNFIHNDLKHLPQETKISIKKQIKKAMRFFKNLEDSSKKLDRRHSFDVSPKKIQKNVNHETGSLDLQKVSERFSITNLYSDGFGNGKGSFRGAPNKKALSDALSNVEKSDNIKNHSSENEIDDIKYSLFKKTSKTKSRKSIHSLFEY